MAMIYITCPDRTADTSMPARAMIATLDLGEFLGGSAVAEEDTDSSVTQLAGGLGLLDAQALTGRIEGSFVRPTRGAL